MKSINRSTNTVTIDGEKYFKIVEERLEILIPQNSTTAIVTPLIDEGAYTDDSRTVDISSYEWEDVDGLIEAIFKEYGRAI